MKIISWNVNGIRAASVKGYNEWFNEYKPDILCVQETKAQVDQLDETLANPDGYYSFWNSADKKGYSGTATFSRTEPKAFKRDMDNENFWMMNLQKNIWIAFQVNMFIFM